MTFRPIDGRAMCLVAVLAACGRGSMAFDGGMRDGDLSCPALRIEPAMARVATFDAIQLRAVGGSGTAVFGIDGDAHGARAEPGGGLRTGSAGTLTVIARDALCSLDARATIEVVGPFDVQPASITIARGATVRFVATGNVGRLAFSVLARPPGAGAMGNVNAMGVFTAGTVDGTYQLVAQDSGSNAQVRLRVDVGAAVPLAPRSPYLAVPIGERVPLEWRGGSGLVDTTVAGVGGRVVTENGRMLYDATGATFGFADVSATDRFTRDVARVRVFVGDALGSPPLPRGSQLTSGDLTSGDFNGDGRADLALGHTDRSARAVEAGGVLVFYGTASGALPDRPSLVIEGERPQDHFGQVLLARDVNSDGFDDLLVGSPDEDLGEADRGGVRLFLGAADGLEARAERAFVGEDVGNRFGTSLTLADINGDSALDLIVAAPGAVSPFNRTCLGGRAYVYRNTPTVRGTFETVPFQILDLRDTQSDDVEAPIRCATATPNAGRSVAVMDVDSDGAPDLAIGAPSVTIDPMMANIGAVLVFRGNAMDHRFETEPTWSIHLAPDVRVANSSFGTGLDVVADGAAGMPFLVVRAPTFAPRMGTMSVANAGAFWVFAAGSLGPRASPGTADGGAVRRVRAVTTAQARSFAFGAGANHGLGLHSAVGDADGDARDDYVLGSTASGQAGRLYSLPVAQLVMGTGQLMPAASAMSAMSDMSFARIAFLRAGMTPPGLAALALWRNTMTAQFAGALDSYAAGAGGVLSRLAMPTTVPLQVFPAGDRSGAAVALGALSAMGPVHAVVTSAGSHSVAAPLAMPPRAIGARRRTGTFELFAPAPPAAPPPTLRGDPNTRDGAQLGASMTTLDFDGDGSLDVAIGDPGETTGGPAATGLVNPTPTECIAQNSMGAPVTAGIGGRGAVRIYSLVGGAIVERFRVVPRRERARAESPAYSGNRFGTSLSVLDANGDGTADLVVGRAGLNDGNGADVVLGRRYADAMSRVVIVCNTGDAPTVDPGLPTEPSFYGAAVAGVGDIDGDGCDDFAENIVRGGVTPARARAGIVLSFGFGAGTQCGGHDAPFRIRVVVDDRSLADNQVGLAATRANDEDDLLAQPTSFGQTLAQGHGDLVGNDGVSDLVIRDVDLAFQGLRGPAVEIISGGYLRGVLTRVCPDHVCQSGEREGLFSDVDYHVLALRALAFPARRVLPSPSGLTIRFGSALAIAELSGDRFADLVVGSADDLIAGPFVGAVRVYRGGDANMVQDALFGDSWLLAVGDASEPASFGASLAATAAGGGWLVVGAPNATRNATGGDLGVAYRWRVQP